MDRKLKDTQNLEHICQTMDAISRNISEVKQLEEWLQSEQIFSDAMDAYDEAISRGIISSNPTQQEIIDHADEIIELVDAIREAREPEDADIESKLDIAKRSVKRIADIIGE